jgi:hypothetical protein
MHCAGDFRAGCVGAAILLAAALQASVAVAEEEALLMAKLYWDRSVIRAERDEVLWLYIEDLGNVRPSLTVKLKTSAGVDLLGDATQKIPATAWDQQLVYIGGRHKTRSVMEPHPATRISWLLRSDRPLRGEVEVTIAGNGAATSETLAAVFREACGTFPTVHPRNWPMIRSCPIIGSGSNGICCLTFRPCRPCGILPCGNDTPNPVDVLLTTA